MDQSNRAIIIVEDDQDDIELIEEAYNTLKESNELIFFRSGEELSEYLETSDSPFFIICDLNLPGNDALTIRKALLEDNELRYKSVPFILWSTFASQKQIKESYDALIQGFFLKPTSFDEIQKTLEYIIGYWKRSEHPKENLK